MVTQERVLHLVMLVLLVRLETQALLGLLVLLEPPETQALAQEMLQLLTVDLQEIQVPLVLLEIPERLAMLELERRLVVLV